MSAAQESTVGGSGTPLSVELRTRSSTSTAQQGRASSFHDWRTAVAGGIAGATAKTFTAPLGRLTILYQVRAFDTINPSPKIPRSSAGSRHYLLTHRSPSHLLGAPKPPGLYSALTRVVREEGFFSLWKGNAATILHRLPYSGINFYTYEQTKQLLDPVVPQHLLVVKQLAAGAVAGLVACSAAYPLDLVRTRLAAQTRESYYQGVFSTLRRVVADEGVAGLYRGLGATLMQVVPSLALSFTVYESARGLAVQQQRKQQQGEWEGQLDEQQQASPSGSSGGSSSGSSRSPGALVDTRGAVEQARHATHATASSGGNGREVEGAHPHVHISGRSSNSRQVDGSHPTSQGTSSSSSSSSGRGPGQGSQPGSQPGQGPVRQALTSSQPLDEGDCIALQVGVSSSGREVVLHYPHQDEPLPAVSSTPTSTTSSSSSSSRAAAPLSTRTTATTTSSTTCNSTSSRSLSNSWGPSGADREPSYSSWHSSPSSDSTTSSSSSSSSSGRPVDIPAVLSLSCGCVSGLVTSSVTFPLDVVRRRMQVTGAPSLPGQPPPGYMDIIRGVLRTQGVKGFYVGIVPEFCKVVPGVAVAFCAYEELKRLLRDPDPCRVEGVDSRG